MTSARRPAGAPQAPKGTAGKPEGQSAVRSPQAAGATGEDEAAGRGPQGPDTGGKEDGDDGAGRVEADLDALVADLRRERDEYLELAQRARADFENYRRRAARESSDAERRGRAGLARELVPAVDNLERALRSAGVDPHAEAGDGPPSEEVSSHEALARGVGLVHGELIGALGRAGVEAYDPLGERFDPAWHEALGKVPAADEVEPGMVVETVERGYRLDGQVLRPARVVVSG